MILENIKKNTRYSLCCFIRQWFFCVIDYSQHLLEQAGLSYNSIPSSVKVITASFNEMELCNTTIVPLHIGTLSVTHEMYVAPQLVVPVIFLGQIQCPFRIQNKICYCHGTTVAPNVDYEENATWSKKNYGKTPTTQLLFYQEKKMVLKIVPFHISLIQVNLYYQPLLMHTWIQLQNINPCFALFQGRPMQ